MLSGINSYHVISIIGSIRPPAVLLYSCLLRPLLVGEQTYRQALTGKYFEVQFRKSSVEEDDRLL